MKQNNDKYLHEHKNLYISRPFSSLFFSFNNNQKTSRMLCPFQHFSYMHTFLRNKLLKRMKTKLFKNTINTIYSLQKKKNFPRTLKWTQTQTKKSHTSFSSLGIFVWRVTMIFCIFFPHFKTGEIRRLSKCLRINI